MSGQDGLANSFQEPIDHSSFCPDHFGWPSQAGRQSPVALLRYPSPRRHRILRRVFGAKIRPFETGPEPRKVLVGRARNAEQRDGRGCVKVPNGLPRIRASCPQRQLRRPATD